MDQILDGGGQTNDVINDAPVITSFSYIAVPAGWQFNGTVTDDDPNGTVSIIFSGELTGHSTIAAGGSFSYIVGDPTLLGSIGAKAKDLEGLFSDVVWVYI